MGKKIILGTLGGTVAGMLVAMAVFMGLLGGTMEEWMKDYAGCLKEMNMAAGIAGSLVLSLFMALVLHKFGVSTFKGGAIAGTWITFLISYSTCPCNRNHLLTLMPKPPVPALLSTSHSLPPVACPCRSLA